MNPELRPDSFYVGGHKLDYENMGIHYKNPHLKNQTSVYEDSYEAFSMPELYDTSLNGKSNKGHEIPFTELSQEEKRALLEYLKLL
jgi:hypothetical protein